MTTSNPEREAMTDKLLEAAKAAQNALEIVLKLKRVGGMAYLWRVKDLVAAVVEGSEETLHKVRAAIAAAQAEQSASATSVQPVAWMRPVRSIINLTDPPVYGPVRYVACDKDDKAAFPVYASAPTSAEDARDAAQWQDHQNLIRASTMKNTLHISLRVNVDGMYNTRDGILDIQSVRQSAIQAPEIVAMTCKRYFTEMLDAIALTPAQGEGHD